MTSQQTCRRRSRGKLAGLILAGAALVLVAVAALTPAEASAAPLPPPGGCTLPTDQILDQLESSLTSAAANVGVNLTPDWITVAQVYDLARSVVCLAGAV
jgi:hypothetical protein